MHEIIAECKEWRTDEKHAFPHPLTFDNEGPVSSTSRQCYCHTSVTVQQDRHAHLATRTFGTSSTWSAVTTLHIRSNSPPSAPKHISAQIRPQVANMSILKDQMLDDSVHLKRDGYSLCHLRNFFDADSSNRSASCDFSS